MDRDLKARYASFAAILGAAYSVGASRGLLDAQTGSVTLESCLCNHTVPQIGALGAAAVVDHNQKQTYDEDTRPTTERIGVSILIGTVCGATTTGAAVTLGYVSGRVIGSDFIDNLIPFF